MNIEKAIKSLELRKTSLIKSRDLHIMIASHMKLLGLHDIADDERMKAHNLKCRINEIDIILELLEESK